MIVMMQLLSQCSVSNLRCVAAGKESRGGVVLFACCFFAGDGSLSSTAGFFLCTIESNFWLCCMLAFECRSVFVQLHLYICARDEAPCSGGGSILDQCAVLGLSPDGEVTGGF